MFSRGTKEKLVLYTCILVQCRAVQFRTVPVLSRGTRTGSVHLYTYCISLRISCRCRWGRVFQWSCSPSHNASGFWSPESHLLHNQEAGRRWGLREEPGSQGSCLTRDDQMTDDTYSLRNMISVYVVLLTNLNIDSWHIIIWALSFLDTSRLQLQED